MVFGLRGRVSWGWGSGMVFGMREVAHQNGHPFRHTLGLESYHPSVVPEDFRSKAQDLPYHPSFGSRHIPVRSNFPNPLSPKKPNHPPPTNPLQTSTSYRNPHPPQWQDCPNPALPERPNHHQKQPTASLHPPASQPPTVILPSAWKPQQAPPTARGTPESKSPPAVSPAQTHLCARVLAVGPRLKRRHRWNGCS